MKSKKWRRKRNYKPLSKQRKLCGNEHEDYDGVDKTFTIVFELGECGNETLYFFAVTIHLLIAELPQLWTDGPLHPSRQSKEIVSDKVKEKTSYNVIYSNFEGDWTFSKSVKF